MALEMVTPAVARVDAGLMVTTTQDAARTIALLVALSPSISVASLTPVTTVVLVVVPPKQAIPATMFTDAAWIAPQRK